MIRSSRTVSDRNLVFRGTYLKDIDRQGRLVIPSQFLPKSVTRGDEGDLLYLIHEPYGFRVDLFDLERENFYRDVLRNPEVTVLERRDAEHYFGNGMIHPIKPLKSPRILFGADYGRANNQGIVQVIGLADYFEIHCLHPKLEAEIINGELEEDS